MGFRDEFTVEEVQEIKIQEKVMGFESTKGVDAEEVLINYGFKIKTKFPTKFGVEYLLAKKYPEKDIRDTLKGFTLKIDAESVFVEN